MMTPGTEVGAKRWGYSACHPDCWQEPHKGVVLAQDDPRAWPKTTAFPGANPEPEAVKAHVTWCRSQGLLGSDVPVLWSFDRVYWEKSASLVPYTDDVAAWQQARQRAYKR